MGWLNHFSLLCHVVVSSCLGCIFMTVFAFEFCCIDVILPACKKILPLFARDCSWKGRSPHSVSTLVVSCVVGWLIACTCVLFEWTARSAKFVFYVFCVTLAVEVRTLIFWHFVFLVAIFFHSWVWSWRENNGKTTMVVEARCSISLFFVWFSTKEDLKS